MKRDEVLKRISENQDALDAFPIKRLAIFGSVARNAADEDSDIDILIEFEPEARVGLFLFLEIKEVLEKILNCRVDLVTRDALKPQLRQSILSKAIYA